MLSTPAGCVLSARCVHVAIVRGLYIAFAAVEKKGLSSQHTSSFVADGNDPRK